MSLSTKVQFYKKRDPGEGRTRQRRYTQTALLFPSLFLLLLLFLSSWTGALAWYSNDDGLGEVSRTWRHEHRCRRAKVCGDWMAPVGRKQPQGRRRRWLVSQRSITCPVSLQVFDINRHVLSLDYFLARYVATCKMNRLTAVQRNDFEELSRYPLLCLWLFYLVLADSIQ